MPIQFPTTDSSSSPSNTVVDKYPGQDAEDIEAFEEYMKGGERTGYTDLYFESIGFTVS